MNKLLKLINIITNYLIKYDVYIVIEDADWVIKHEATQIKDYAKNIKIKITRSHIGIRDSIIHFASINQLLTSHSIRVPHKSNKVVVTWYHVVKGDIRVKLVSEADKFVERWHTSCTNSKKNMIDLGIEESKIEIIPIGINLNVFKKNKSSLQCKYKDIDGEKLIIIGSFQKDGAGWGSGMVPKMIKGPDIFCDCIEELSKHFNILVLLTGPARGYVISRLKKSGIRFKHQYLKHPNQIVDFYNACDLYLITSREEGGPKSLLESMACQVPVISTKVGMSIDVLNNNINGVIVDIEDTRGIVNAAKIILNDDIFSKKITTNALRDVEKYDYKYLVPLIKKNLYEKCY